MDPYALDEKQGADKKNTARCFPQTWHHFGVLKLGEAAAQLASHVLQAQLNGLDGHDGLHALDGL